MVTFDEVWEIAQKNDRVCPQPNRWMELYKLLPERKRVGNGSEPALPLILAVWWDTPHLAKIIRLREHLEWASTHGCLEEVYKFLSGLPESDWFHSRDWS